MPAPNPLRRLLFRCRTSPQATPWPCHFCFPRLLSPSAILQPYLLLPERRAYNRRQRSTSRTCCRPGPLPVATESLSWSLVLSFHPCVIKWPAYSLLLDISPARTFAAISFPLSNLLALDRPGNI